MEAHYFLFGLAFIFTLFASVQDLRKREVANWLNFSLIGFALAYRAFYSFSFLNFDFFLLGILGLGIFVILAHLLYYGKAFAGGDAKLLMGFGVIIPYSSYASLVVYPLLFIFLLFFTGAIYSLVYSVFIIRKNKLVFFKEFNKNLKKYKFIIITSGFLFLASLFFIKINIGILSLSILLLLPFFYLYTKSLEKSMIKLYDYRNLTEGDWIIRNIKLGNKVIRKNVHGLSEEDIRILKKYKKKVWVKEGIPFVPAFLISLIIMVCVFLILPSLPDYFLSLF